MADSFTEVSEQSWLSRLFGSIKSVFVGIILFLIAFPLLFWNEGRAVRTAKSLSEGSQAVVSVASDTVDGANEGKLVHMTGEATTKDVLSDATFGVTVPAIKLTRKAEMYQWQEEKKSETRTKLGGGTETVTNYTYKAGWSPSLIDSSAFKNPEGHQNPDAMPVKGDTWTARTVTLGAFTLSPAQVDQLSNAETLRAEEKTSATLPRRAKYDDGGYYIGADASTPVVGDERITFQVVRPATVSIVGTQVGNTFEPYHAEAGDTILLVSDGTVSADGMFKEAQSENAVLTWILRGAGFLLMLIGLVLIFSPLGVVADVVPFVGSLLRAGTGLFSFMMAACLSLVTIAIAWVVYRPLIGVTLLLVALAAVLTLSRMAPKRK